MTQASMALTSNVFGPSLKLRPPSFRQSESDVSGGKRRSMLGPIRSRISADAWNRAICDIRDVTFLSERVASLCLSFLFAQDDITGVPRNILQAKNKEEELYFTAEDLTLLCNGIFGLRHLTGQEPFEKECAQGMDQGCSLNLTPERTSRAKAEGGLLKWEEGFAEWARQSPRTAIFRFQDGVDDFIGACIDMDLYNTLQPGQPASSLFKVVTATRFLFVRYDQQLHTSDASSYGKGLGRYPKFDLPYTNIKPIPPLSIDECATPQELEGVLTDQNADVYQRRLVTKYRTRLLRELRAGAADFFRNRMPAENYERDLFATWYLKPLSKEASTSKQES
ncbi:MAG: hypothetical protein ACHQT8_02625 [Chlamydiales bacterium]